MFSKFFQIIQSWF